MEAVINQVTNQSGGIRPTFDILQPAPNRRQYEEHQSWRVGLEDRSSSPKPELETSVIGNEGQGNKTDVQSTTNDASEPLETKRGGGWRGIKARLKTVPKTPVSTEAELAQQTTNQEGTAFNTDTATRDEDNEAPCDHPVADSNSKWAGLKGSLRGTAQTHSQSETKKSKKRGPGPQEEAQQPSRNESSTQNMLTGMGNEVSWVKRRLHLVVRRHKNTSRRAWRRQSTPSFWSAPRTS